MKTGLFVLGFLLLAIAVPATPQQISDPNPAHVPDAEIDNKRPFIKKKEKAPTSRALSGKVVEEINGTPLKGAVVTLTDLSSHEKREMITKEDGRYNFDDLSFSVDYELKARYKNTTTDVRKLSQYDHSVKVVRILTVPDSSSPAPVSEAKKDTSPESKK
ncbi:MAG: carboxypeptidase regulatory-like domain-containing protein [Acidobacteriaceae bacterium]|nr:carboxypeptidase regulatory-like domain-containing protein [Acidobacteriaceae bacterium]